MNELVPLEPFIAISVVSMVLIIALSILKKILNGLRSDKELQNITDDLKGGREL